MKNLEKDYHAGRPGIIIGGGASAVADLRSLPPEIINQAVFYALNQNAFYLLPPHHIDYVVFMDNPVRMRNKALAGIPGAIRNLDFERVLTHPGRISQNPSVSAYRLPFGGYWDGGFTGSLATWVACYMGCDPVILTGCDCYTVRQSGSFYYSGKADPFCSDYPLENHLNAWRPALEKCPHPERIKAASGPLMQIFGRYGH